MSLDLQFNNLQITSGVLVNSNNKVECRIPLTEEELKGVIKVNAVTYLLSNEVVSGEVRYSGRAIFTIVYKNEEGIKKYESGVEYSYKFPCESARENTAIQGEVFIENTAITELNGIVTASGVIVYKGELTYKKQIEYFEKDKNLFVKNKEYDYIVELNCFSKESKIEEEFEESELISSVLLHSEKVSVSDCQCGIGSVIMGGDVEVNMVVLPIGKSLPVTITKKIPYRIEVEVDGITPANIASCCVCVKGASLKVFVDENKNKSSVSIEVNLSVLGKTYETVNFYPCEDLYSQTREIYIEKEKVTLNKFYGYKCVDFKVDSEISINEDKNTRLICLLSDKIEEISVNGLDLTGAVSFDILKSGEEIATESVIVPISYTLPLVGNSVSSLTATVTDITINEVASKWIISFKVSLCYMDLASFDVFVITKVTEGEDKPVNDSAISVYIPKPNDSLWDISKELGVSEEEILKINKDLTFPLSGEERIVIYREMLIKE